MRRSFPLRLIGSLILLCGTSLAQGTNPPQSQPKEASGEDLVVARVSGEIITEKQLLAAINQIANQQQTSLQQKQQKNAALFQPALDNLVSIALLKNEVKVKHVVADPAKVDQNYRQMTQGLKPEELKAAMEKQGVTEASIRKSIEENLSYNQVLEEAVKTVPGASEEALRKFYDENPASFNVAERVHSSHILLRVEPDSTPEVKADKKKQIDAIRTDIESQKISFADAAAKFSQDPTNAQKGGDLGFFSRGQMVKPFEDAAFSTKPGSLSPVVETQFGYHLINVIELKPAGKVPFDEVKARIKQYLDDTAKRAAAEKYLTELRAAAKVEMFMTLEEWNKRHP